MTRNTSIAVALAIAVIGGVAGLAFRSAQQDRSALLAEFGEEHLSRLRLAIHEIEGELSAVGQHLDFATRLVASSKSGSDQHRELEALLAVVRSYRAIAVYDGEGRRRVLAVAQTASSPTTGLESHLVETARAAMSRRGMAISPPLDDPPSPWHRAFAAPVVREGVQGAVVILVDLKLAFERLRLVAPDPAAKLILLGPHGRPAPLTDASLVTAAAAPDRFKRFTSLVERMRRGHSGTLAIPEAEANGLGLGEADAIAVFASIPVVDAGHWSVAIVSSTETLRSQERAIVARMGVLGAVFVLALVALSAYLVVSARRTIAVQERLRSAEQVAHLREKSEKILENVPVGVAALDDEDRISAMNRSLRERVPPSALGAGVDVAFPDAPPDALEALRAIIARARSSGTVQSHVAQPLALSGRDTYFAVHAVPLSHPLPDVKSLLVLEDVTELRALSSQLLRAEKLATVGVLAAGIAHEIGTPLGVVRGRAEILVAKLGAGNGTAENARIIIEEIDRISRTIEELLDFSRTSKATAVSVQFQSVAANVAELLAFEARSRKVSIDVETGWAVPALAADPDQLKQVLVNLALNAVHACSAGGHVTLWARPHDATRAAIEVIDDGAGIPDGLRHRVFDPFFTTKKRGKGTGLGLTMAAQIVRNHGGEIDLESAVGRGTRVTVLWPLARSGTEEINGGEIEGRAHSRGG